MKAINIYITPEQKVELDRICYKYQVSKSTIAENLLYLMTKYLLRQDNGKNQIKVLGTMYVYEQSGKKTSIKPRLDPVNNGIYENLSKAYTNVIQIYLHKNVDKYIDKENVQKLYNDLNTKLQKTNEPNWDFNRFRRQMAKYEKGKQQ